MPVLTIYLLTLQYPPDTFYNPTFATPPAMPPLCGTTLDSSAGITIRRISDYSPEWDWYPHHEYAKVQPWNADMSLYRFYSMAIYDTSTCDMVMELPDLHPIRWSNADPNVLYGFKEDGTIIRFDIATQEMDTLITITGFERVEPGPGEGNLDIHDRRMALAAKRDTDMVVLVVNLQSRMIEASMTLPGAWGEEESPRYVDWVSVSQSGNYVGIMWDHNTTTPSSPHDGHYGVEIYDAGSLLFLRRLVDYGNHGDFCMTPDSEEVFVQFYGEGGTINAFRLRDDMHIIIHDHEDFGYGDAHISCRNIRRPGWAYVSTDPERGGMVLAVRLDGSKRVEIFGHHFSSAANYDKSPMPVPSPDGRFVMFKSDFGNYQDSALVYDFVASYDAMRLEEKPITSIAIRRGAILLKGIERGEALLIGGSGRVALRKHFENGRIETGNRLHGLFLLRVQSSSRTLTRPIILP